MTGDAQAERLDVPGHDQVWRVPCAGSVAYVAVHALVGGRSFGGIRIRAYPDEAAALHDALALARAMSAKLMLAGLRGGGAKSVLIEPPAGVERRACVAALGAFIESLEGRYCCGPDLGFGPDDDAALRAVTRFVAVEGMASATARSVEAALRAACPEPRRVAIQGLGTVGAPLAASLAAAGVELVVADPRQAGPYPSVAPDAIHREPCDVFAPCAVGGVLDAHSIPELRCRVVCGGANNPLAGDEDAWRLHERGIVLVPDVIASSGAAIVGASTTLGEEAAIEERLAAVGPLTARVLAAAAARGLPPVVVAAELAEAALDRHRRG